MIGTLIFGCPYCKSWIGGALAGMPTDSLETHLKWCLHQRAADAVDRAWESTNGHKRECYDNANASARVSPTKES